MKHIATSDAVRNADHYGNTALHLCVIHSQKEMYAHLLTLGVSEQTRNAIGDSCLLLAARTGNKDMLELILQRRLQVQWAYGPVTSYMLSLREVDTVQVLVLCCT